ncbi:MAG: DUF4325 domain-containing protein [Oscillospiraceae bacterium]|jgi:anti-sigma regulatory factor (Ser/Thr protein kinase)|nr:DUF4325 domain-containing protein [Oscillospiraceae bacterium]
MSLSRVQREEIKKSLLEDLGDSDGSLDVSAFAKSRGVSGQTIYRYLRELEAKGQIVQKKIGNKSLYLLKDHVEFFNLKLAGLDEEVVWKSSIRPLLEKLPDNAFKICNYVFTEMLNNAIEHSAGSQIQILVSDNGFRVQIVVADDGVGIFTKISEAMGLTEKSFAILELAKGKFTTDPSSHTGEGVFFSSKAADSFSISADGLLFFPLNNDPDADSGVSDFTRRIFMSGTTVLFEVKYNNENTLRELFDKYTNSPEDYGFTKTVVPVRLLEFGDDNAMFVSRSQAKRLLVRFERFELIELDFTDVEEIGQGFADEIFRVFPSNHPNSKIVAINAAPQVSQMIAHVTAFL